MASRGYKKYMKQNRTNEYSLWKLFLVSFYINKCTIILPGKHTSFCMISTHFSGINNVNGNYSILTGFI